MVKRPHGLYRRPNSSFWWYTFTVQGRRLRRSTGTADRETAGLIAAEARAEALLCARGLARPSLSLDHACGRYFAEHASRLASVKTIDYQIRNWLALLGPERRLAEIDNAAVADAVATLRARMSDSSVNRHLTLLRALCNRARDVWGNAAPALSWRAHRLREPAPRDRTLRPDQALALIEAAAPHLRPLITIALLTGIRRGNLAALDWSMIDLPARSLRLTVKGGRRQTVALSEAAVVVLANLGPRSTGPVFLYRGRRLRDWRRGWRRAQERAGLEPRRWHDLRHTFATWARQAGVDLIALRDALGHADIATTSRYAHAGAGAAKAAVERVAAHFGHTAAGAPAQPRQKTHQ